jgi:hypothetical protein
MMATQDLRDARGFLLGRIETDSAGVQTLRDIHGFKRGSFDPRANTTRDVKGFKVGSGNLLTTLLR